MGEENNQLYYYHGDHLGSAQIVTDPEGKIYEQLEYTPYGELWVEHLKTTIETTPFRFTGKERDSETGLYYFGARYLNPQTSMWLSADPAMGEYIPQAPVNDEAKKHNENLPGLGGVFNYVNLHAYHYAGNNPVVLWDPMGLSDDDLDLIQKATDYLKTQCENYIDSLKEEAYATGRVTASKDFEHTINGVKVKGSITGVVEYNFKTKKFTFAVEAGLDIGLGTPGQAFSGTGVELTIGLRASFGSYKYKPGIGGLRSISLAVNAKAEILGVGTKFEYRRQLLNFDTNSGKIELTVFSPNISKIGVATDRRFLGFMKLGGGGRINGL